MGNEFQCDKKAEQYHKAEEQCDKTEEQYDRNLKNKIQTLFMARQIHNWFLSNINEKIVFGEWKTPKSF